MSAAVIAILASQSAATAEQARCFSVLKGYDATIATVEQARDYAGCVRTVHGSGEPMSATAVITIKLLVVACLICGVVVSWGMRDADVAERIMGFFGGILLALASFAVLAAASYLLFAL